MENSRLSVLVSAYACEPHKGSEPGVGWNWVKQIARFADIWVITRANNRGVIEEELRKNSEPNVHFVYIDLPSWVRFWKKGQRGVHLYYYLWQLKSYFVGKRLSKKIRFDITHHLTFGVFSYPSGISLLNLPFVWGPVGGVDRAPRGLKIELGIKGRLIEFIRDLSHRVFFYFDPFVRYTVNKSRNILCRTKETYIFFNNRGRNQCVSLMLETGKPPLPTIEDNDQTYNKCKILFAARLIAWKGGIIALKSFKVFLKKHPDSLLEIAGGGYQRNMLQKLSEHFGISSNVIFLGEQQRINVLKKMKSCDIFLYPSLRDGGTWAVMEAMSLGKPVVCLDHSGPGVMINEKCGIKITPSSPDRTINEIAEALNRLAIDTELRKKMGEEGRARIRDHFSWKKKGEFIHKIYMEVLGNADTSGS